MTKDLYIKGAREHNLKNISVSIPRDRLVVLTGLSGSGKSSLAFDTIYAEGQRRYVESLSSYARQFLGQMEKPDVDYIEGLSPAISIDQKTTSKNPRSTVGTVTEIHDYLRLMYARIGVPHCPVCGREIQSQTPDQIADYFMAMQEGTKVTLMAPVVREKKGMHEKILETIRKEGFSRVRVDGKVLRLDEDEISLEKTFKHTIEIVIDRIVIKPGVESRISESVEQAVTHGDGLVTALVQYPHPETAPPVIARSEATKQSSASASDLDRFATLNGVVPIRDSELMETPSAKFSEIYDFVKTTAAMTDSDDNSINAYEEEVTLSTKFACPEHGVSIEELEPRMFSFNNPFGACPVCNGLGFIQRIDAEAIITEPDLSIPKGALSKVFASMEFSGFYRQMIDALAEDHGVDINLPWKDLPEDFRYETLYGTGSRHLKYTYRSRSTGRVSHMDHSFEGVLTNMERRYRETSSDFMKEKMEAYMTVETCEECGGKRLRPVVLAVTVGDKNIAELSDLSVHEGLDFINSLALSEKDTKIATQILKEIRKRFSFLVNVGLDYLTLSRSAGTLSGGEAQRIRLATQIGSYLVGVMYILDEPSIGLHQRDNEKLLKTLRELTDLGNTLIVVEHDEDTMYAADHIVDIGPLAGVGGGYVVAEGTVDDIKACKESVTGQYLSGVKKISVPAERRPGNGHALRVVGARENNLKNIDVSFPLGKFVCVTGVSGSGKSSLVNEILYKVLAHDVNRAKTRAGAHDHIEGIEFIDKVIDIDQSPIGRTPRSNPATYTGVFTPIRDLFAKLPEAKLRGYEKGRFSFNVKGGRCEACKGDGIIKIEMHFLPDVYVPCEVCKGHRYNRETLEVKFKGKSIYDVLEMTVTEALGFFKNMPQILRQIQTLDEVGLGYIKLGQPSTQLSGGEAQRVKLATELSKRSTGKTVYILDEPTTGLHFADVAKLLEVLNKLVETGNTVIVIEHNLDVIKSADHIIDLGPEGGDRGGSIVAEGTPEEIAAVAESYTGQFLKKVLP